MRRAILALFAAFALLAGLTLSAGAQDVDCGEISFERAQEILAQDPSDPNDLDRDNDGEACDSNAGGGGGTDGGGTDEEATGDTGSGDDGEVSEVPATGAGPLSSGSDNMLLVTALGGMAALLGFAGLRVSKQA